MKYPKFIKQNGTIGICAPSAGIGLKSEDFDKSLNVLKQHGYHIIETESVRSTELRSANAKTRAKELKELFTNDKVDIVMAAAGGDFLYEMLGETDFETMQKNPKWLLGMSDPTSLLFTYTVKYDVATMYGINAGSFDLNPYHSSLDDCLSLLEGNLVTQESYDYISSTKRFSDLPEVYDKPNYWKSNVTEYHDSGRLIGGCLDVLKDLIGTKFADMKGFNERYKDDGIILYFEDFALSAEAFYLTILQMRYAGWLDQVKAVIVGRTLFGSSGTGLTYEEALERALGNIPYFYDADIGHTIPTMTFINGAICHLDYQDKKASIKFELK